MQSSIEPGCDSWSQNPMRGKTPWHLKAAEDDREDPPPPVVEGEGDREEPFAGYFVEDDRDDPPEPVVEGEGDREDN